MKTDALALNKQFEELVEEVRAIVYEFKFRVDTDLIRMKHSIGMAVVTSPVYRKYAKGQGKVLSDISEALGMTSDNELRYCVQFYEKFRDIDVFFQKELPSVKSPKWYMVKSLLLAEPAEECAHVPIEQKVETVRVVCGKCNARIRK